MPGHLRKRYLGAASACKGKCISNGPCYEVVQYQDVFTASGYLILSEILTDNAALSVRGV